MVKTSVKRTPVNENSIAVYASTLSKERRNYLRRMREARTPVRKARTPVRKARTVINTKYKAGALNRVKRTQAKNKATKNNGARTMFNKMMKTTRLAAKTGFRVNSKRVTLKLKPKVVKALKNKSPKDALVVANVPNMYKTVLIRAAPKIKRLLSGVDWHNGLVWTIIYLTALLQMLENPRLTNNVINRVIKSSMRNQYPRRFIGGKPPIPEPEPELGIWNTAMKMWSKYFVNKRASNRARNAGIDLGEELVYGFFDTYFDTIPGKYGKSQVGIYSDYIIYLTGFVVVVLAYFPYLKPGAKKILIQIFDIIEKFGKKPLYGYLQTRVLQQRNRDANTLMAPGALAEIIAGEGLRFAVSTMATGGNPAPYLLNITRRRMLPST